MFGKKLYCLLSVCSPLLYYSRGDCDIALLYRVYSCLWRARHSGMQYYETRAKPVFSLSACPHGLFPIRTQTMPMSFHAALFPERNFYRPKRSFGQGNVFTGVCDSVHGGRVWSRGVSNFSGGSPIFQGGLQFFGGVSPILGGLQFWGVSNFSGVSNFGGSPIFGVSNFSGGLQFFGGPPIFRGGALQPEYGQRSAGTHPTGMHSCNGIKLLKD